MQKDCLKGDIIVSRVTSNLVWLKVLISIEFSKILGTYIVYTLYPRNHIHECITAFNSECILTSFYTSLLRISTVNHSS